MQILSTKITKSSLPVSKNFFGGEMVKGVVDVERQILAIDAEMHADLERLLLADGSEQYNLWGINLYPAESGEDFVEFDSMINLRPAQNNRSRGVEDPEIRKQILKVVDQWIDQM